MTQDVTRRGRSGAPTDPECARSVSAPAPRSGASESVTLDRGALRNFSGSDPEGFSGGVAHRPRGLREERRARPGARTGLGSAGQRLGIMTTIPGGFRFVTLSLNEVFVPLVRPAGRAQADFGEAWAVLAGVLR